MADGVTATSRDAWPIAIIHSDLPQASNEVRVPDIPRTLWTTSSVLMGEEKCSFLSNVCTCVLTSAGLEGTLGSYVHERGETYHDK